MGQNASNFELSKAFFFLMVVMHVRYWMMIVAFILQHIFQGQFNLFPSSLYDALYFYFTLNCMLTSPCINNCLLHWRIEISTGRVNVAPVCTDAKKRCQLCLESAILTGLHTPKEKLLLTNSKDSGKLGNFAAHSGGLSFNIVFVFWGIELNSLIVYVCDKRK